MPTRELLSLLPIFEVIYDEKSLSRAAQRLGVSQPAVSQALAKLRAIVSDDLFHSTGRGMRPTSRADQIIGHVRAAFAEADAVRALKESHVLDCQQTFAIDVGIGLDVVLLQNVYGQMQRAAPNSKLKLCGPRVGSSEDALRSSEVNLAIEFLPPTASGINFQPIMTSSIVAISRQGHAVEKNGLTESQYFSSQHATVDWGRSTAPSWVSLELDRLGGSTKSAVCVQTLSSLVAAVCSTDLLATVSATVAKELQKRFPIAIHELPVPIEPSTLYQVWHKRFDDDPAHVLLRTLIAKSSDDTASSVMTALAGPFPRNIAESASRRSGTN